MSTATTLPMSPKALIRLNKQVREINTKIEQSPYQCRCYPSNHDSAILILRNPPLTSIYDQCSLINGTNYISEIVLY